MSEKPSLEERLGELAKKLTRNHQSYSLQTVREDIPYPVLGDGINHSVYWVMVCSEELPALFFDYAKEKGVGINLEGPKAQGDGDRYTIFCGDEKSSEIPRFRVNRVDITVDVSKRRSTFALMGDGVKYGSIKELTLGFLSLLKESMQKYKRVKQDYQF